MSIVLFRVDERLIHGQVVIGWGHQLRPDRYAVVDDDLAGSDWEQDLYRLGAGTAQVVFATAEDARDRLSEWRDDPQRTILLTRDVATMWRLGAGGMLSGERVNLGGIHHGPGRRELLTYLHLTPEDVDHLVNLAAEGVEVSARDLPDAHRVPLETLMEG
ncbi:MAG: PTS sugar transporter subunit IIB [Gemmatimonadetes bacterium]|nr:PTS sugar transporter subunit IIB [Gemmatimonadota bacterium]